ncbi:MAG: hypothetical protein WC635_10580 [Bacteriovorax sp.]
MKHPFLFLILLIVQGCAVHLTNNPKTPAEQIARAAETGDLATVKKLIGEGVEPEGPARYADGIEWANLNGHHEIVKILTARCMEIFVPGKNCGSFPFWIAQKGDMTMLNNLFSTKRIDSNQLDRSDVPILAYAIQANNIPNAKLLLARGADPDKTLAYLKETNIKLEGLTYPWARDSIEINNRGIALLQKLKSEGVGRVEDNATMNDEGKFEQARKEYQRTPNKLVLSEEARRYKVQAEDAVNDKKFEEAAELYAKALDLALWWPEGHFNRALVLGEGRFYEAAIREMKRYLALVPRAPDARAAQDKIYMWERKAGK